MTRSRTGFTLIELLIVVAIIAILAAIAVPNFLEAQTRAKISRAKSDLRSVATALESYAVDNNVYPYAESIGPAVWLLPGGAPRDSDTNDHPGGLTSPIAYLTSLPQDPFEHALNDQYGNPISEKGPYYFEKPGFNYKDGIKLTAQPVNVPADAVGTSSLTGIGADTPVADPGRVPQRWILFSVGPDREIHLKDANGSIITRSRFNLNNRYDPTNGTVSTGNVLRFPGGGNFP